MKTFETEKHNIPDGATHYSDSSDERYFSWFMHTGDEWFIQIWSDKDWVKCKHNEQDKSGAKPIPQANIETPEEKEVFDSMKQSNDQSEINKPSWAKWSIGDSVTKTKGSSWTGKVAGYYSTSLTSKGYAVESLTESGSVQIYPEAALCSVETEAELAERERLESGQSLYELVQSLWCTVDSKYTPHPYSSPMVDDKTKEMYARLARAVDYRKES